MFEGIKCFIEGAKPVTFNVGDWETQWEIEEGIRLFALAIIDESFFESRLLKAGTDSEIKILANAIASGRKLRDIPISRRALNLIEAYYVGSGRLYKLISPEQYENIGKPANAKPCLATGCGRKDQRVEDEEIYEKYESAKQIMTEALQKEGILKKPADAAGKTEEAKEAAKASRTNEENEENKYYVAALDSKAQKLYLNSPEDKLTKTIEDLNRTIAEIMAQVEEYSNRIEMVKWTRGVSNEEYEKFLQAMEDQKTGLQGIINNAKEHMAYIRQELEDRKRAAENSTPSDAQSAATPDESDAAAADTPSNDGSKPASSDQKAVDGAATSADGEQTPAATPSGASQATPAPTSDALGIPKKPSEETATPSAEEAETVFTPIEILDSVRKAGYSEDEIRNNKGFAELVRYETMYEALSATYGPDEAAAIIAPLPESSIPLSRARQILTDAGFKLN